MPRRLDMACTIYPKEDQMDRLRDGCLHESIPLPLLEGGASPAPEHKPCIATLSDRAHRAT